MICFQVVKLHTKLGKPIPSQEPVVQGKAGASTSFGASSTSGTGAKKLVSSTPKINFVASEYRAATAAAGRPKQHSGALSPGEGRTGASSVGS